MPGTSTEQVVDKGIRQKSTKEWTHSLTAVPFVRGHRSVFPRTPRNTGVYTRHPTFVTATSAVLTRLPAKLSKKRNACLHAVRQAVEKKIASIHGLRSEGVNAYDVTNWRAPSLCDKRRLLIGSCVHAARMCSAPLSAFSLFVLYHGCVHTSPSQNYSFLI